MRIRELRATYSPVEGTSDGRRQILNAKDAAALLVPWLRDEAQEVFIIACLDTKHQLIAVAEVSRGSLDAAIVHPREVFKLALLANAAGIVTAHNHPSGILIPSDTDLKLWERLNTAGGIVGIDCLDHLIIQEGRYWSARESGRL